MQARMNLLNRAQNSLPPVLGRYFTDLSITRGAGCYLFDDQGKKYLDFTSGIATCATGHSHPVVVKAITEQAKKLIHINIGIGIYEPYIKLAEELRKIVPVKNAQF